jgi:hypothetical protein
VGFPDRSAFRIRSGMGLVRAGRVAADRFGIVGELFSFFWKNKRGWIMPMLVALLLVGTLIALAQSSAIAPFIYTLF